MIRRLRKSSRRFRVMLGTLGVLAATVNILCNPFTPPYVLRWIQTGTPPTMFDIADALVCEDVIEMSAPGDRGATPAEAHPDLSPEFDDVVAVQSKRTWRVFNCVALPTFAVFVFKTVTLTSPRICVVDAAPDPLTAPPRLCRFRF